MKVKTIKLKDALDEYYLKSLNNNRPLDLSIDLLIYYYEDQGYDGTGVAVYRDSKRKWHLDELGHCSCYGPFDDGFNLISYTKPQIVKLLEKRAKEEYNKDEYQAVLDEVKKVK